MILRVLPGLWSVFREQDEIFGCPDAGKNCNDLWRGIVIIVLSSVMRISVEKSDITVIVQGGIGVHETD